MVQIISVFTKYKVFKWVRFSCASRFLLVLACHFQLFNMLLLEEPVGIRVARSCLNLYVKNHKNGSSTFYGSGTDSMLQPNLLIPPLEDSILLIQKTISSGNWSILFQPNMILSLILKLSLLSPLLYQASFVKLFV